MPCVCGCGRGHDGYDCGTDRSKVGEREVRTDKSLCMVGGDEGANAPLRLFDREADLFAEFRCVTPQRSTQRTVFCSAGQVRLEQRSHARAPISLLASGSNGIVRESTDAERGDRVDEGRLVGKVPVERPHANASIRRDLLHRHSSARSAKKDRGMLRDPLAIALRIGSHRASSFCVV